MPMRSIARVKFRRENFKGLAEIGAFGIKVPKKYGGLGLSQSNYGRAAVLLGSWDGNVAALVSAHQSIGVPQPLLLFGTEEQKQKYLPRVAGGEISAFALTEVACRLGPGDMSLRAEPSRMAVRVHPERRKTLVHERRESRRAGGDGAHAVEDGGGKERKQITAFIVDVDTPGLEIAYRCRFMGLRALYNAVVRFTNVRVPRENIIFKEGPDSKVALTTLNTGRLTLPAACVGVSKRLLEICRKWAGERIQWGVPIGKHAAIAGKIAEMAGNVFAMEAMTFLTSSLLDRKAGDLRIETAMCKMWATETTWQIADDAMQVRGGRGYETAASLAGRGEPPIAVERFLRDCRINTIFEGSSEIMRLFIAREALDPHLKVGGAIFNTQLPMSDRAKARSEFRKILRRLVSAPVATKWRRQDRQFARSTFGSRQLCRAHEQATCTRIVSRHGAVRPETRSRATAPFQICRCRDGVVCDQRDVFVRAMAARPG